MSNFDLIDDYLTNRLSGDEMKEFELGMNADPALKSEVARQSVIVEGIKKARAAELKAMLNKVPIGTVSLWSGWEPMRIAATIGVAGLLITGLYFFTKDSNSVIETKPSAEVPIDSLLPDENNNVEPVTEVPKEEIAPEKKESTSPQIRKAKPKTEEAKSPKVRVNDPSSDMLSADSNNEPVLNEKSVISLSTIKVSKVADNKQYTFHYQFEQGKLFLYGSFEESLYEILEVHGTNHALFLYFKDNFYHLDESKTMVTELTAIRERSLISKLKEFRKVK